MMNKENQLVTISGFLGFSIGVMIMIMVNSNSEQNLINKHELILENIVNDVYEYELGDIEYEVCEECGTELTVNSIRPRSLVIFDIVLFTVVILLLIYKWFL